MALTNILYQISIGNRHYHKNLTSMHFSNFQVYCDHQDFLVAETYHQSPLLTELDF